MRSQDSIRALEAENHSLTAELETNETAMAARRHKRFLEERNMYLSRLLQENGWKLEL